MKFVLLLTCMEQVDNKSNQDQEAVRKFEGNIWGWKWSWISLAIILLFMTVAVCRYLVIKPDRLIHPEKIEEFG